MITFVKRLFKIKNKEDYYECNIVRECTLKDIPIKLEKKLTWLIEQRDILWQTGINDAWLSNRIYKLECWINFFNSMNKYFGGLFNLIPLKFCDWIFETLDRVEDV